MQGKSFDKVKDIVRGTITVNHVGELHSAYEHFKSTPGVVIVSIKEKLEKLQNITVNFVFEQKFIGEMQFRFNDYPPNYHANHFLYEIHRSKEKIEILESINKMAVSMALQGKIFKSLKTDMDLRKTKRSSFSLEGKMFANLNRHDKAGNYEMIETNLNDNVDNLSIS